MESAVSLEPAATTTCIVVSLEPADFVRGGIPIRGIIIPCSSTPNTIYGIHACGSTDIARAAGIIPTSGIHSGRPMAGGIIDIIPCDFSIIDTSDIIANYRRYGFGAFTAGIIGITCDIGIADRSAPHCRLIESNDHARD